MHAGQELTVEAAELVAGGDALARLDTFPIFVPGLFPGDRAVVRITEVKKGFARAEPLRILSPSSWRRTAPCPVAGECGGCDWTALRLDRQLEAKRRILSESLRRVGKFDVDALPPISVHTSPLNYRLRSRLHEDEHGIGFFAARSHRVVPLPPECEVVGPATALAPRAGQQWEADDALLADGEFTLRVGGFSYQLSTDSFFQVNRHLLSTLLRLLSAHADGVTIRDLAIDLYAGVGFFTLPLADRFDRVFAIEGSPESARYARRNVPSNVSVVEAPVETQITRIPEADLIFLDPPRAGARPGVIETVAARSRHSIVYLSCDPVTFSRDARLLAASGWNLFSLDLVDLFPNTHHVETLASFGR